jgi:hypothetical protein
MIRHLLLAFALAVAVAGPSVGAARAAVPDGCTSCKRWAPAAPRRLQVTNATVGYGDAYLASQ